MDTTPKEFRPLLAELKKIREHLEQLRNNVAAIRADNEAQRESERNPSPPLVVNAELQVPEVTERDHGRRDDRAHGQQVWLTVGTWLAFIAAAIYAGIAARQLKTFNRQLTTMNNTYKQVEKQTTLLHQQVVGTQGARIDPPEVDLIDSEEGPIVRLTANNRGFVTGHISGKISVIRKFRNGREVELGSGTLTNEPIAATNETGATLERRYAITGMKDGFTPTEIAAIKTETDKEVLFVKGSLSYENGFHDPPQTIDLCFSLFSTPRAWTVPGTTTTASPGHGFATCDGWQLNRNRFLESQKQSGSEKR